MTILETYEDGSGLVRDMYFGINLPASLNAVIGVIGAGTIFTDGSTSHTLTADQFNELGMWELQLIKPADRLGSGCHSLKIYQDGLLLGNQ